MAVTSEPCPAARACVRVSLLRARTLMPQPQKKQRRAAGAQKESVRVLISGERIEGRRILPHRFGTEYRGGSFFRFHRGVQLWARHAVVRTSAADEGPGLKHRGENGDCRGGHSRHWNDPGLSAAAVSTAQAETPARGGPAGQAGAAAHRGARGLRRFYDTQRVCRGLWPRLCRAVQKPDLRRGFVAWSRLEEKALKIDRLRRGHSSPPAIIVRLHELNRRTYDGNRAERRRGDVHGSACDTCGNRRGSECFAGSGRSTGANGGIDQAAHRLRNLRRADDRRGWKLPEAPLLDRIFA